MSEFLTLLGMNNLGTVLVIAILAIVGFIKIISWAKSVIEKRKAEKDKDIAKGKKL
jgi:hypothetical protein